LTWCSANSRLTTAYYYHTLVYTLSSINLTWWGPVCRRVVQDLNKTPRLKGLANASFDAVLCQLSIDYLTRPLAVVAEAARVLRPRGLLAITFSNRLFLTKVCWGEGWG
jgi:SAM-dependent methyltransferase